MVDVGAQPFLSNPSGLWGKEIKSHMVSTWESVISVAPHDSLLFPTSSPERKKERKKEGMIIWSQVYMPLSIRIILHIHLFLYLSLLLGMALWIIDIRDRCFGRTKAYLFKVLLSLETRQ